MGLGELADDRRAYSMMPSVRVYERDEAKYLRYWRAWAKAYAPPALPTPRDTCEPIGRPAPEVATDEDEAEIGQAVADDGTLAREPAVSLGELAAAPEKYLGRVTLANVAVDGIATRLYEGAPLHVLCARDPVTGAAVGPGSTLALETGKEPLAHRLRELRAGQTVSLDVEVRRLAEGYNARVVQFVH
jgi:hypothetical protein